MPPPRPGTRRPIFRPPPVERQYDRPEGNQGLRVTHHTTGMRLIAIGSVLRVGTPCHRRDHRAGPHIPTPSTAKSRWRWKRPSPRNWAALHQLVSLGRMQPHDQPHDLKCSIDFRYHDVIWSGHGRNWRAVCNGNDGISKNPHHACWYVNWRLKRLDDAAWPNRITLLLPTGQRTSHPPLGGDDPGPLATRRGMERARTAWVARTIP